MANYIEIFLYPALFAFILLVIHSAKTRGAKFTLIYFVGGYMFGIIREYFYVNYKQIYNYSGITFKIFGVPPIIPLGWLFTFYIGLCFGERILGISCKNITDDLQNVDKVKAQTIWVHKLLPLIICVAVFTCIVCYSIESCAINMGWWEFIGFDGKIVPNPVQYMWTQTSVIFTTLFFLIYFKQIRNPKNITFWIIFTGKYISEDFVFQYLDPIGQGFFWIMVFVLPLIFYEEFSIFYLVLFWGGRLFVNVYDIAYPPFEYTTLIMKLMLFVPIACYFIFHLVPTFKNKHLQHIHKNISDLKSIFDYDITNKKILLRVDIETNIDPNTGDLIEDSPKIDNLISTLSNLGNAAIVILAHQGKYGESNCVSMKVHCKRINELMGDRVQFIDDIFGKRAIEAIQTLKSGEILMLENIRTWKNEEKIQMIPDAENSELIKTLSPYFDYFVIDSFSTANLYQVSLVGWPKMIAGPLVKHEFDMIQSIMNPNHPAIWLFGGIKARENFFALKYNLEAENIDFALIAGTTAFLFYEAKGKPVGLPNRGLIFDDYLILEKEIKHILDKYGDKIVLPVDFACNDNAVRREILPENMREENRIIGDIGVNTIKKYREYLETAQNIIALGSPGKCEEKIYSQGTMELLKVMSKMTESGTFVEISGNSFEEKYKQYCQTMNEEIKINLSSGGSALLDILSGKEVPLLQVLKQKSPE